jgi:hypothetical protein
MKAEKANQQSLSQKNTDKIWCPEGGQYKYVEVCEASCKKKNKCEAYAEYREPRFI